MERDACVKIHPDPVEVHRQGMAKVHCPADMFTDLMDTTAEIAQVAAGLAAAEG
jgi:hypothetical protein